MLTAGLATVATLLVAMGPRLRRLRERYDSAALQPINGQPTVYAGPTPLEAALQNWVREGAGSGSTLLPWRFPASPCPLACAVISSAQRATVHAFGYRLAGYHQLDSRSRLGGIAYRISVQLRPLLWFLPRRSDEPWDDAWLTDGNEARLAALAAWRPRRPTLIVLDAAAAGVASRIIEILRAGIQRNGGQPPIRLLILDDIDHEAAASAGYTDFRNGAVQRNG